MYKCFLMHKYWDMRFPFSIAQCQLKCVKSVCVVGRTSLILQFRQFILIYFITDWKELFRKLSLFSWLNRKQWCVNKCIYMPSLLYVFLQWCTSALHAQVSGSCDSECIGYFTELYHCGLTVWSLHVRLVPVWVSLASSHRAKTCRLG